MYSSRPHTRPMDATADSTERLGADDMATRREGEFLAAALARQQQASARALRLSPGVCAWCGERCQPLAVYCDADCRADAEQHQQRLARQGRGR